MSYLIIAGYVWEILGRGVFCTLPPPSLSGAEKTHPQNRVRFNIEINPSKSLSTKLTNLNGFYKFNVYLKSTDLPSPWISKAQKRYKINLNHGDLHRFKRISSNFDEEIPLIQEKFMIADYPLSFISSVINKFRNGKYHGDEILIIPYLVWNYKTFYIHWNNLLWAQ